MPPIHNLLFPAYIEELRLDDYVFRRVHNYRERAQELNQPMAYTDEIHFAAKFGGHAITAEATAPDPPPPAALGWADPTKTRLDDILLVLSLLTRRHVWVDEHGTQISDHRQYQYGVHLETQLPQIIAERGAMRIHVGFEPGVNAVLRLVRSEPWQRLYARGHYLLIANHAFRWQILETTFTQCWTIWEHMFALHNRHWLGKQSLRRLPSTEKIGFLSSHYDLQRYVPQFDQRAIEELKIIRNELVHFGKFPPNSIARADDFIEWTEYLIAASLNLRGGVYQTVEEYEAAFT